MTSEKMSTAVTPINLDREAVRREISKEYAEVATNPGRGFHFHTGRPLAKMLGYDDAIIDAVPHAALDSFAGTGNPFSLGEIRPGQRVVDLGSGAGFDSIIAASMVGPTGRVIGVDMTPEMLDKARGAGDQAGLTNVEFREGHAESMPVPDGWADVVISNGVVNLCPDKPAVFAEMYRVLKPGGRLQIGDILVEKAVPQEAKENIDLWTG
ncbi:MAG: methyltransferase domain-containing protein [Dehalococcoidia bacterium]